MGQELYINKLKTICPMVGKLLGDSQFTPYIGSSSHRDVEVFYTDTSAVSYALYWGFGVGRDDIVTIGNTNNQPVYYTDYKTVVRSHNELNYCINISMKNVKNCIDTDKYKYVFINDKILPIDEFIKQYGSYAVKVNKETGMIYGNEWEEDNFSHSPFYTQSGGYAQIVGIVGNRVIPIIQAVTGLSKIPQGYNRLSHPFRISFSSPFFYNRTTGSTLPDGIGMLGADDTYEYNQYNELIIHSGTPEWVFVEPFEHGGISFQLDTSMYVEPNMTEKERFFMLSPTSDFSTTEENVYGMLYSKGGIEQYLDSFNICYNWMYPIEDLFVNGRKVRHPSVAVKDIYSPTVEVKKVRHIL